MLQLLKGATPGKLRCDDVMRSAAGAKWKAVFHGSGRWPSRVEARGIPFLRARWKSVTHKGSMRRGNTELWPCLLPSRRCY
jgi:hypothetical protein